MIGKPIALIQVPIIGAKVFPNERSERVFASELCSVQCASIKLKSIKRRTK